jgi:hypothetical protein
MIRQKGTRVWYNMCIGGLKYATVDSTGRLPDVSNPLCTSFFPLTW